MKARSALSVTAGALAFTAIVVAPACTDPVRDAQIEELGGEDPAVAPGPDHRPGQPCLVCHSESGPAKAKFAVAGTVYETAAPNARGAAGVTVRFVDGEGFGPLSGDPTTGPSGNFFVPKDDWDVLFPFRVGLYRPPKPEPIVVMQTTVNREGSCNFCHRPNLPQPLDETGIEQQKRSAGQIYVGTTAGAP